MRPAVDRIPESALCLFGTVALTTVTGVHGPVPLGSLRLEFVRLYASEAARRRHGGGRRDREGASRS